MRIDPERREDGVCARYGCTRRLSFNVRRGLEALYVGEPFCSTECCKAYHGIATEDPEVAHARRRSVTASA